MLSRVLTITEHLCCYHPSLNSHNFPSEWLQFVSTPVSLLLLLFPRFRQFSTQQSVILLTLQSNSFPLHSDWKPKSSQWPWSVTLSGPLSLPLPLPQLSLLPTLHTPDWRPCPASPSAHPQFCAWLAFSSLTSSFKCHLLCEVFLDCSTYPTLLSLFSLIFPHSINS